MKTTMRRLEREHLAEAGARHCPEHGHRLVPIHRAEDGVRSVIGWTCTEPYCGHVEIDPRHGYEVRSNWHRHER